MLALLGYAGVAVAVAWICNAMLVPRLISGRTSRGKASAAALLALLVAPTAAAVIATAAVAGSGTVYGAALYFYTGYAVGLACFIVLNRRFRRIDETR